MIDPGIYFMFRVLFRPFVLLVFSLCFGSSLAALPVDLTTTPAAVREGFEPAWAAVAEIPADPAWTKVAPGRNGQRPLRVFELIQGLPKHERFSWRTHPPRSFTILLPFEISADDLARSEPIGVYFAIIGVNWEVYLNGKLMRSEIHRDTNGNITRERNQRSVLVALDQRLLRPGPNILGLHIVGDPSDINTGLFRTGPYRIDRFEALKEFQTDLSTAVLIFLYFFVGVFHLVLFLRLPSDRHNLWFGLFSIFLFAFNFLRGDLANAWIDDTFWIHRVEISSFFLLAPLCGAFLNTILKDSIGKFTLFSLGYTGLCVAAIVAAPMPFVEDVLDVWLLVTLLVTLPFYFIRTVSKYFSEIRKFMLRDGVTGSFFSPGGARSAFGALAGSVPGNLFVGAVILAVCATADILDNLYWHSGASLVKYGFFFFVSGTTLVLANRFISIQKKIETLNLSLERRVEELGAANNEIGRSEEAYRLLVDGTLDIIFAMDLDGKVLRINKGVQKQLGLKPERAIGMKFSELVWWGPLDPEGEQELLREKLSRFLAEKKPISFKLNLKSTFNDEPKEFQIRLEYLDTVSRQEIIGHAQSILEDSLLKYFVSERQKFEIGNYLLAGEDITRQLIRNLAKYLDPAEVAGIRVCLREIIINAIEHGNLAVTYDEKTSSQLEDRYREFLRERQADPRYATRRVRVEYLLNAEKVVYKIEDEGDGFDVEKVRARKAAQVNAEALQHGRGIMMTEEIFDEVTYNKKGNGVLLTKFFANGQATPEKN